MAGPDPSSALVTVLMAVHNGERHLPAALGSVINQTYKNLEIVVVDDGSTDSTATTLADCQDLRLRVIRNPEKIGLARSLNRGIDLAKGSYIARMDADDVCHPERIERQVQYMEHHPDVGLLGTACRLIDDDDGLLGTVQHPTDDAAMRWRLLFGPALAHPTAMIRTSVLRRHGLRYNPQWPVAQDYEFWPRVLQHCRGANLTDLLLDYRLHGQSASAVKREEQDCWAQAVCEREAKPFLPPKVPSTALVQLRRMLAGSTRGDDPDVSQLRCQLLILAESYIRGSQLGREEAKIVRNIVVATVLADAGFCRPFSRQSISLVWRAFFLDPMIAVRSLAALVRHYLARKCFRE